MTQAIDKTALAGGDRDTFVHWMTVHQDAVFGLLFRLLRDYQRAEDLTQETFFRAHKRIRDRAFHTTGDDKAWLLTVAANLARSTLRKKSAAALTPDILDALIARPVQQPDLPGEDSMRQIERAIQNLDETDRSAVILYDINGLTYTQVGEALGCSEKSARRYVSRAHATLARELEALL